MKNYLYLSLLSTIIAMTLMSCSKGTGSSGTFTSSTAFESGSAVGIMPRSNGSIALSIPADPGGPEYLWFYFNLAGKVKKGQSFAVVNAAGAHQTGDRWNITAPVFSAD